MRMSLAELCPFMGVDGGAALFRPILGCSGGGNRCFGGDLWGDFTQFGGYVAEGDGSGMDRGCIGDGSGMDRGRITPPIGDGSPES